jgi:hypothetical protein
MNKEHDDKQRRCPRLGGAVSFLYCRTCEEDRQPCFKIIDCWWESFDIAAYLEDNFSEELCRKLVQARPKPKVNQLLELIEAAKQRAEKD